MNKSRFLTSFLCLMALMSVDAQTPAVPRLVVNILVDQLRTDYLEAFAPLYGEGGLKRLLSEARYYTDAAPAFRKPDRASAAASLVTGTVPYDNGITGLTWLSRKTLQPVFCVDDSRFAGIQTQDRTSPANLLTSSLSDELEIATGGNSIIYSICPERDMAVLMAGHNADGAFWLNDQTGAWSSTSYYGDYPHWVAVYERANTLATRIKKMQWTPLYQGAVSSFHYFHSASEEQTKLFKHKFEGDRRYRELKTSPLVNEEVNHLVEQCLASTGIGRDYVPDMLNIGYYAGNYNHASASQSPAEMQDAYARLDRSLAKLIASVEKYVGAGKALFVLSSTGYADSEVAAIDYTAHKIPTGTFDMNKASMLLNMYLGAIYGQEQYVEATRDAQIFLNHRIIEQKNLRFADVLARCEEFLVQMSGVREVYTTLRLKAGNWEKGLDRVRNSWNAVTCGDIIVDVHPGWKIATQQSTEIINGGEPYCSYPLFFFGPGISPERLTTPVVTTVIAPTVAQCLRIRAPNGSTDAPLIIEH